jgi:hypothetical protein
MSSLSCPCSSSLTIISRNAKGSFLSIRHMLLSIGRITKVKEVKDPVLKSKGWGKSNSNNKKYRREP